SGRPGLWSVRGGADPPEVALGRGKRKKTTTDKDKSVPAASSVPRDHAHWVGKEAEILANIKNGLEGWDDAYLAKWKKDHQAEREEAERIFGEEQLEQEQREEEE
ncbi:unnamed protein product, partial [Ectocarpus sp. 8 AP-2014]